MDESTSLAQRFEENRPHLRAVAYRMLGSLSEAEDAVQESWLRLSRTDTNEVENLGGWLTTVVARVCLNMLHSRKLRAEVPIEVEAPDPNVSAGRGSDPEQEALMADSVGLALLVVLDRLSPAERLAFVLHDMFDVPFEEIAPIVGRSPAAARQLGSRARRRVQGADWPRPADHPRQREIVEAFLAASHEGNFEALVAVLDPDVLIHADSLIVPAGMPASARGARAVAERALAFSRRAPFTRLALVNGAPGLVVAPRGRLFRALAFTFARGKIVDIDVIGDPERLRALELAVLSPS